jgi:hypothetical protein
MTKDAHWVIAGVSLAAGIAVGALSQMDRVERCEAGSETALESARAEATTQAAVRAGGLAGHQVAVAAFDLAGTAAHASVAADKADAETFRKLVAESTARQAEAATKPNPVGGTAGGGAALAYEEDDDDYEDQQLELLDELSNSASEARMAAEAARRDAAETRQLLEEARRSR